MSEARSLFSKGTVAVCLWVLSLWSVGSAVPPNIVYFLADDLGREDCGFMGGTEIHTPQLDRLAREGVVLDAFYVQPVCSPTRAALLTGRYPMRYGLQVGVVRPFAQYGLPLEERLLPEGLRQAGYQTAIVGKWHLGFHEPGYLPTKRGFDFQYGHYTGALDYFSHRRDGGLDWHRQDEVNHDEGYTTHLLTREAIRFLRERDPAKPFFLYVPYNAVHTPLQVPGRYREPYANLPPRRQAYAAMTAALDESVGAIADVLVELGLRDKTLILFSSDNGGPQPGRLSDNGQYRAGKGTLYEGGVRVCAFASWPGRLPSGVTNSEPMHIVDWYPTLLKLAGTAPPAEVPLDGKDVWPLLTEGKSSPHTEILLNSEPTRGALRMGDWKLIVNGRAPSNVQALVEFQSKSGQEQGSERAQWKRELYHLATDPYERENAAEEHPEILEKMEKRYFELAAQAVRPKNHPVPEGFKVPAVWGEHPDLTSPDKPTHSSEANANELRLEESAVETR